MPPRVDPAATRILRPLIATDDVDLLDDLLRLTAAAAVEPDVATTLGALRAKWTPHSLVVIGIDIAEQLPDGFVPRRGGIVLACREDSQRESAWGLAASIGADHVAILPDGEVWLVDRLASIAVQGRQVAPVVGVIGGCGGAGSSSLSAAVTMLVAQRDRRVAALDLDRVGTGLDVILGFDRPTSLTWADLAHTKGRVRGAALFEALANGGNTAVLGWGAQSVELDNGVVGAAVDGLTQSCDLVVVDLPRALGEASAEAICRCDFVTVVVPRSSTAVVSTGRLLESPQLQGADLCLVSRGPAPVGLRASLMSEALAIPLLCDVPSDHRMDRRLEQGLGPMGSRGGLRVAARAVLNAVNQGSLGTGHQVAAS